MTIQEIARAFDMTLKDFSQYIGYSRPELYHIASGKHEPRYSRVITARNKLVLLNEQLYEKEKKKIYGRALKLREAIEAFEKSLLNGGDINAQE